jgi:hypothetical protein
MEKKERYKEHIAGILTNAFYAGGQTGEFKWIPGGHVVFPCKQIGENEVFDNAWPFITKCSCQAPFLFSAICAKTSDLEELIRDVAIEGDIKGKIPQVIFPLGADIDVNMISTKAFFMLEDIFGIPPFNFLRVYEGQNVGFVFSLLIPFLDWIDWAVFYVKSNLKYIKSLVKE